MRSVRLLIISATIALIFASAQRASATIPVTRVWSQQQVADFEKRAEQGDADAQAALATGYIHGIKPLIADENKGYKWLMKAAIGGDPWAETYLGWSYDKGKHVTQDYTEAMKWYLKAADQQYPAAEDLIGKLYREGHGVEKDYAKAVEWFQKSADQIYTDAAADLAYLYATGGPNLRQDYEQAFFWGSMSVNKAWPNISEMPNEMTSEWDRPKDAWSNVNKYFTAEQKKAIYERIKKWVVPAMTKWTHPGAGHMTSQPVRGPVECMDVEGKPCSPEICKKVFGPDAVCVVREGKKLDNPFEHRHK